MPEMEEADQGMAIAFFERLHALDADDPVFLELLATYYTEVGRIQEGLRLDQRHTEIEPENPTAHYNLACSQALSGQQETAIETLRTAITKGFCDVAWMLEDPDLESLLKHPEFIRMIKELTHRTGHSSDSE